MYRSLEIKIGINLLVSACNNSYRNTALFAYYQEKMAIASFEPVNVIPSASNSDFCFL